VVAAIVVTVILGAVQGAVLGGPIGFLIGVALALLFGVAASASTFILLDMHRMMQQAMEKERLNRSRSAEGWLPVGTGPEESPRKS
jgi:hypothetical protein